jgi:hypothetical protein
LILEVGQAVALRIPYPDGVNAEYARPYLIVKVTTINVSLLAASSLRGKEDKLLYNTNYALKQHFPPFLKPTFIKLDSLQEVAIETISQTKICANGQKLNQNDLQHILQSIGLIES